MNLGTMLSAHKVERLEQSQQFLRLYEIVNQFAKIIAEHDVVIEAFSGRSLEYLHTLEEPAIERIYSNFKSYFSVVESATRNKINLKDSRAFVLEAMKQMGVQPHADFMERVKDTDIIEMYDLTNRQTFRNLKLYELTKYSLGDLISFEWPDLYQRASAVTTGIQSCVIKALEGKGSVASMVDVPVHIMKEYRHNPPQIYEVSFDNVAPLYDIESGQKSGLIVNERGRYLGDLLEQEKIDFI